MDFRLSPEQERLRQAVRDFLAAECSPHYANELDAKAEWPIDLYRKIAQRGWVGYAYPREYGGDGGGIVDLTIVQEELAYVSFSLGMGWAQSAIFGGGAILFYGDDDQKGRFLPKLSSGETIFCFALTEPNAGSDAGSMQTTAVDQGDHFLLNGSKIFISGANIADYAVTFARTDKSLPKHKGLTAFIVDLRAPGVTVRPLRKMGTWPIHSCEIFFKNLQVPKENTLGGLNKGWTNLLRSLDLERIIGCGAQCVGASRRVVDDAITYAKELHYGGQPLIKQQSVAHALVDMEAEVEALRIQVYRAAWMLENNIPCSREASIAKVASSEAIARLSNMGMQILGPYGYFSDWDEERQYRDSRMVSIGGGSSQIQRNIIAGSIGL